MEETMALIERSHHGDKDAREQLVEENMGLVWSVVRRFTGRGTDTEDLFQIGAMGLLKARIYIGSLFLGHLFAPLRHK